MDLRLIASRLAVLSGLMLAVGCGSGGKSTEFAADPSETPVSDGGNEASSSEPPPEQDSGPVGVFTSADAAGAGVTFDCKPGTYSGTFETHVSSDAGGLIGLLYSFDVKGTLTLVIVGQVTQTTGEIPMTSYSIAPGAKLTGTDQSYGGTYSADLDGQLDCATKTFTGTLSNGSYDILGSDAAAITLQGSLSGTYQEGDAGMPQLAGTMNLSSSQLTSLGATGPWTATLQ